MPRLACKPFGDIHSICPQANTPILVLLMKNDLEFTIDALLWEKYEGHELPLLAKITHK